LIAPRDGGENRHGAFCFGHAAHAFRTWGVLKSSWGVLPPYREGQRPRCPIRRRTGNEDVAPPVRLNPARKLLAGCIAFCDSDSCAKHLADGVAKSCAKLLAGCIAFCDSDSCAKHLADGVAKSCAKPRKPISGNHCPTRRTRPTCPTSPSAKREAQSLALPYAKREAL
ncbi:MAG: hypothetical protein IKK82_02275, partial [Kiritimatiellae bacterium]|nr:hypothetical protein [Kiritimatiellia bacterium]